MNTVPTILTLFMLLLLISCGQPTADGEPDIASREDITKQEKAEILRVLNGETAAAFNRDYPGWKTHWIQEDYVSKTYMNFADSSLTETLGWEKVDDFVRTYIEEHPEPAPLPALLEDVDLRLYGTGAWVTYIQNDPTLGRKRETRLMEKVDGQWKIAGMQTVIYGFEE